MDPVIYFVTNICPHYRLPLFRLLGRLHRVRFLFFSEPAEERGWEGRNPSSAEGLPGGYLPGLRCCGLRWVPSLYRALLGDRYDILIKCINGKMPLLLSYLIARTRRIPFILWTGLWHNPGGLLHRAGFPVVRHIYRHADAVVVYGSHTRGYLAELGVKEENIFEAWQAVDNGHFGRRVPPEAVPGLRKRLGIGARKVILYVGRLEKEKGLEYLGEALREFPDTEGAALVAAGEGRFRKEWEEGLARIPHLAVRFPGYVEYDLLPEYYAMAWVLVLPSVTTPSFREPWGLVVNEAFNQGCPVVATRAVGAARGGLLREGETGLVVPERDAHALGLALRTILGDARLRATLGGNARREIREWTFERMEEGFEKAIRSVRGGRGEEV
ncbi:MAG: glycosyltransferase family 4 protein [Bacteroidota bacterium]